MMETPAYNLGKYIKSLHPEFNVYLNHLSDDEQDCIGVFDTGGYAPTRFYGNCLPVDNLTVQVLIRASTQDDCRSNATLLYNTLDNNTNILLHSDYYLCMNAVSPPAFIGKSQTNKRGATYEYSINFELKIERT